MGSRIHENTCCLIKKAKLKNDSSVFWETWDFTKKLVTDQNLNNLSGEWVSA
jgi:hypothetical protein